MMLEGHERTLLAAQGYCELGMFDDALAEIEGLPKELRALPSVLEMQLVILMQAKRWKAALTASRELCDIDPQRPSGFIQGAFCLHELGHTAAARTMLLTGPETLQKEATFHYNLACYEAQLGELDSARAHLERSFELDKKLREYAKSDPDLAPLRS